jgi:hypothetical protein
MQSSLPSQQSQCHNQVNAFPSKPEFSNNWIRVSYKRGGSPQDVTETKTNHSRESEYWLNQTSTSNRYTALLEEASEDQQPKTQNLQFILTGVKNI